MRKLSVIIPAYNEESIIETSARNVFAFCERNLTEYDWHIIILINGSRDSSPEIALKLAAENGHFKAVIMPEPGRGRALKRYWSESSAEIVMYMDADLAVDLKAIPHLIKPLSDNISDLVIGARFHPQSKIIRSLSREIVSRVYNLTARLFLGNLPQDLQCGFKAVRHDIFKKLSDRLIEPDWIFDTELLAWAQKFKYRIGEIPVDWQETRLGKRPSTVNLLTVPQKFIRPLWQLRQRLKNAS
jgi:glycosyltransferase involved in cell wall biosynthesis